MNASTEEQPSSSLDTLKWGVAILLLAGAVVGNYVYGDQSVLIRAVSVVAAVIIAGIVAGQTEKGRNAINFAKEARTETRKVVWPTRQEAVQTTGIVLVATLIMSLVMWGLDSILFELVGFVTGLKV
ncbi:MULTISPECIES: preprotein translocase subunit SecE [Thalassotalea]|uniref:Protein translocase subunit SecE n=1 Tax=Thalassotalea castellviae TaxID=3075612 RepID=A0ABU3A4J6_9GAMM|nr:preprotein translocase subunit SecE [Thalassotalea sp. W431]MDT0604033.1 preprotein translocase subunit SecE [Thalassotalea sp. W431]